MTTTANKPSGPGDASEASSRGAAAARPDRPAGARRSWWAALGVLLAAFAALSWPAMFAGLASMFSHGDMVRFHLPQINYFISHPLAALDYPSTGATMPGHHLLFAWLARAAGYTAVTETTWTLRLAHWALAAGMVAGGWAIAARLCGQPWRALVLTLPLAASPYVLGAAIWITTDDAALLHYTLLLAALTFRPDRPMLAAAAALLLASWRQIYLPVAAAAAFFARPRRHRLLWALLAPLPAVLVVALYVHRWGGFTPKIAQQYNELTFRSSVPLQALALTGLFTIPYIAVLASPVVRALERRRLAWAAAVGALAALALWLGGPSAYDGEDGRWGSIVWLLARWTPVVAGRSPVVLVLAAAGAAVIATLLAHAAVTRQRPVELGMLLLCFAGISAQVFAWQRYVEPVVLLTLAIVAARIGPRAPAGASPPARWALAGPALLACGLAGMSQARLWGVIGRLLG